MDAPIEGRGIGTRADMELSQRLAHALPRVPLPPGELAICVVSWARVTAALAAMPSAVTEPLSETWAADLEQAYDLLAGYLEADQPGEGMIARRPRKNPHHHHHHHRPRPVA